MEGPIEFVVEDGEAANGGSFTSQGPWAKGNGMNACREEIAFFGLSEVAFGADPEADCSGGAVFPGLVFDQPMVKTRHVGSQVGQQADVVGEAVAEAILESERGVDEGEPGITGLFEGFSDDGLPFMLFVFVFTVELRDGMFGEDRDNAMNTQLRRFLEEPLHGFSFEDGLEEDDLERGRGDLARLVDFEVDLAPGAIEDGA